MLHYINLDHRKDRNRAMLKNNGKAIQLVRYSARDGSKYKHAAGPKLVGYTRAQAACAYSHAALWRRALETGKNITIAEDDVILRADFARARAAIIAALPLDWDIILWGWNPRKFWQITMCDSLISLAGIFSPDNLYERPEKFQACTNPLVPLRLVHAWSMCVYTISPACAAKMLPKIVPLADRWVYTVDNKNKILEDGIDTAMNAHYRNLSAWICLPPIAITNLDQTDSDANPPQATPPIQ